MTELLRIRRIAVAIDATPASRTAVAAMAELAARLGAELLGVFVEDLDLLHASGLPGAAEVDLFSATLRPIGAPDVERRLRGQAARARQSLEESAERSQVRWEFRVLRGRVTAELAALATEADLVSLSRGRHRQRLGSTARKLLSGWQGSLLLLPPQGVADRPAAVLYDGSEPAARAVVAAGGLSLAAGQEEGLWVLVPNLGEEETGRLEREVSELLAGAGISTRFHRLPAAESERLPALERALEQLGDGTLVIPAGHWLEGADLLALVDRLERPVLLVA